jgi:hypothetical protein
MKLKVISKTQDSEDIPVYECEFCKKSFKKETTILTHICEKKKRWSEKDTKLSTLAYHLWSSFFEKHIHLKPEKRTFKHFINNQYYSSFIKFAKFCIDSKVLDVEAYANWLFDSHVKIDDWVSDGIYLKFLIEFLKKENSIDAVTRSLSNIQDELFKSGKSFNSQLFNNIGQNKTCHMIIKGEISPWLLYNSDSGTEFLSGLNESQIQIIYPMIDPPYWEGKFEINKDSVNQVKNLLQQKGI